MIIQSSYQTSYQICVDNFDLKEFAKFVYFGQWNKDDSFDNYLGNFFFRKRRNSFFVYFFFTDKTYFKSKKPTTKKFFIHDIFAFLKKQSCLH